jgi:UDP-glucose 4-epimerase
LVANINRAKELLGYQPKYDIRSIVETAYKWHKKLKEKQ